MKPVLIATLLLGGCAVYGTELRSLPTSGSASVQVDGCRRVSWVIRSPASDARFCFTANGVAVEVEAMNASRLTARMGPLFLPIFPVPLGGSDPTAPLEIELGFEAQQPHAFRPWAVSLQTDRGETIGVSKILANVSDGRGVHTVEVTRRDGAVPLPRRCFLTFERPIPPDQAFSLTLRLIDASGADVQLPTIFFRPEKRSFQ